MLLLSELKDRNVLRVGAAYIVAAWIIVQVVDTLGPAFGFGDGAVRLTTIVLGVGLIPLLVLTWVFELTPAGLKRDRDVQRSDSAAAQTDRRLDRAIIIMLAFALTYFAFDKFIVDPGRDAAEIAAAASDARSKALVESYGEQSIAVLPFSNLSAEQDQVYFSDGMAEELINLLATIPHLRVISRSSAFSFKDQRLGVPEIAERLNVAYVLEGSVRRSGDTLRITVQLIEARSDTQMLSLTFDRTLGDIFEIQDEIAAAVVGELRPTLLGETPVVYKTDPQAYALYLQARHLINLGNTDSTAAAETLLTQGLEIDPDYVPALNTLAELIVRKGTAGALPADEAGELVRDLVDRALAVDPENGFTHALSGYPDGGATGDMRAVARALQRGLSSDPSHLDSIRLAAQLSLLFGRIDQAVELYDHVLARDPLCSACLYQRAMALRAAMRLDEAEAAIRYFRTTFRGGQHTLGTILLLQGDADSALAEFDQLSEPTTPQRIKLHGRALALHDLDRNVEFESVFAELRRNFGEEDLALVAEVYAWIGDNDAAFEWMEKALQQDRRGFVNFHLNPLYRGLHSDTRWNALRERVGVSPEQLSAIQFDVHLAADARPRKLP